MSDERKYQIAYDVKREEHTKAELQAKQLCGTDAIVIVSILRDGPEPFEGPKSFAAITLDGYKGGPIPDAELFQAFAFLAAQLAESPELAPWQLGIASATIDAVRTVMRRRRGN